MDEHESVSQQIKAYLARQVVEARHELAFMQALARELGWESVRQVVADSQPTLPRVKRGVFGEVLTAAILRDLHDYTIPVEKLQFAITPNQSLPSTDTIAVKLINGVVVEFAFVESKLRTVGDTSAAVQGHTQLKADYSKRLPDMILFVLARLFERNSPLYNEFAAYLRDREDTRRKERFRLGLIWDKAAWTEKVLENLNEEPEEKGFPDLHVHLARLQNLVALTEEVFAQVGVGEIIDGD